MKILKFGGKSLANGQGIENVISIIEKKVAEDKNIVIVLSARGNSTDKLQELLDLAKSGKDFIGRFEEFKKYQQGTLDAIDYKSEFKLIEDILKGVRLIKDYNLKIQDQILSQGELLSMKLVVSLLALRGIISIAIDSRNILKTDSNFGSANIMLQESKKLTNEHFKKIDSNKIPVMTGYIASNSANETTTLGRNGSNYSASLLANFLNATEIISYTHVSGIYTANPEIVKDAKVIRNINYVEASELANFGASILHTKTIPLLMEKNIALRIVNTFKMEDEGALISNAKISDGIKSISVQNEVDLISMVGKGLLGKRGVDARIFSTLNRNNINIGIISQGSSERGISFVIAKPNTGIALDELRNEFDNELTSHDVHSINAIRNIAVVTITGQKVSDFSTSLDHLKQNKVEILLINSTVSGNNIGLVINKNEVKKAVNIIHSQIFGMVKTINIAIIGKGTVGGSLINQILNAQAKILEKKNLYLKIFAIAGSEKVILNRDGLTEKWKDNYETLDKAENITTALLNYAADNHLENLIAIDNTASEDFVENYISFVESGFDLISSNKIANTQGYNKYKALRESLKINKKQYLYETNVGAGLPIIDTIRMLHESGENITRIKGVFSGSLSYLFNSFSKSKEPFSYYLKKAMKLGFTEPDAREDLSGNDVAKKLLILARELDLANELEEVSVESLIPKELRNVSMGKFIERMEELDIHFGDLRKKLKEDEVLRYVGDLSGNLKESKGKLEVKLTRVNTNCALGNLAGSDSIFEIYTASYGDNPITIIGAGAGAEVTARGVFGDLLRIADKK